MRVRKRVGIRMRLGITIRIKAGMRVRIRIEEEKRGGNEDWIDRIE